MILRYWHLAHRVVLAVVLSTAVSSRALAQRTWEDLTRPNFSSDEFERSLVHLRATDAQVATLRMIYNDLAAAYASASTRLTAERNEIDARRKAWQQQHPQED